MKKLLFFSALVCLSFATIAQSNLIISEYVEGWSTNKAIEIYNPTSSDIDLSAYRIVRYSNGSDVPPAEDQWAVELPDQMLGAYETFVVVLDKRDPSGTGQEAPVWDQLQQRADVFLCPVYSVSKAMYFNGNDAMALEEYVGPDWEIVDLFGRYGQAPAAAALPGGETAEAWTDTPPYFTGEGLALTADHTLVRKSTVAEGVTSNPTMFNTLEEYDSLWANTFKYLRWHEFDGAPANAAPVLDEDVYKIALSPSATNGTIVTQLAATDEDQDDLEYFLDYGNFVYIGEGESSVRHEPFALDKATGTLTLEDQMGLDTTVLDSFYLKISVTDRKAMDETTVLVIVTDGSIVSVEEAIDEMKLQIYPNPASNRVYFQSPVDIRQVEIFDVKGSLNKSVDMRQYDQSVFVGDLEKGIYFLKVRTDNGVITKRFVKE